MKRNSVVLVALVVLAGFASNSFARDRNYYEDRYRENYRYEQRYDDRQNYQRGHSHKHRRHHRNDVGEFVAGAVVGGLFVALANASQQPRREVVYVVPLPPPQPLCKERIFLEQSRWNSFTGRWENFVDTEVPCH